MQNKRVYVSLSSCIGGRSGKSSVLHVWLLLVVLCTSKLSAQEGVFIANTVNFFVHSDTVNILGSLQNKGNLGSKPGSVIRFAGLYWMNDTASSMPDERSYASLSSLPTSFDGLGGQFWFTRPWNSSGQSQLLMGGYAVARKKGASFPNLKIDNPDDVFLAGDIDAQVRNVFQFESGRLWLNGRNLMIGVNDPGTILNYDRNRFVVTGTGPSGGFLYRAKTGSSSGTVVFPIGADLSGYAPLDIVHSGLPQDFKARVFNSIYSQATTGTTGDPSFVANTWNIGKESLENAATTVRLQHTQNSEGAVFGTKRDSSYVTLFNRSRMAWDTVQPAVLPAPGSITTGAVQTDAYINIRSFIQTLGADEFLSKSVNTSVDYLGTLIGLSKSGSTPQLQPDGSYNVRYLILVRNFSKSALNVISLSDNLRTTFPSPVSFSVTGLKVTGQLVANPAYNGVSDTMLVALSSRMEVNRQDTITLDVNIRHSNVFGTFYNWAIAEGMAMSAGNRITVFSRNSDHIDTSSNAAPSGTPVSFGAADIRASGGFSPNNDGVNDRFTIASTSVYNVLLEVVDRWGVRVYRSNGPYRNDWDGTSNQPGVYANSRLPDGTYYYNITLVDKQTGTRVSNVVGFLTIRR